MSWFHVWHYVILIVVGLRCLIKSRSIHPRQGCAIHVYQFCNKRYHMSEFTRMHNRVTRVTKVVKVSIEIPVVLTKATLLINIFLI